MKPGIYKNMPFSEYQKIKAFHKSISSDALRSGIHLGHRLENGWPASQAMRMGSIVDSLVLEPELFEGQFGFLPESYTDGKGKEKPFNRRSNTCKEMEAEIVDSGRIAISHAEYSVAKTITKNVMDREGKDIEAGTSQLTIIWIEPTHNVLCKGRIDLDGDRNCLIDLKTCRNASPEAFARDVLKFGYHVQGAAYLSGYEICTGKIKTFDIIAAENEPPYAVARYSLGEDTLLAGMEVWKRACLAWKKAMLYHESAGNWRGYSKCTEPLDIPLWARLKELESLADDELANAF